jgi:hypothetical protein
MKSFKDFVDNNDDGLFMTHFDHKKHNPDNPTREESVQEFLFGANDYLPYKSDTHYFKESIEEHPENPKRVVVHNDGKSGPAGLVVPRHILEGAKGKGGARIQGMNEINEMRAKVYGSEHRDPLPQGKMLAIHKESLAEHFAKPEAEQIKAEHEALGRLRAAGHLSKSSDTLDEGEKTDTVHHEFDEKGRSFIAKSAKGIAGHSFYTSGSGKDQKHHVINTCAGQTKGCGGGVDAKNIADTSKGTCFAPKAEIQYAGAAIRRHCQTQAMADPKMTKDWIIAHTGSLRRFAEEADRGKKRALFRPNVLNEMDRGSSSEALHHLNKQRKGKGLPPVVSNSYGKTNEQHDPENNSHVSYSNTGPKVKKTPEGPKEVPENIRRDSMRVQQTVTATDKSGNHHTNREGQKTPPKGSYMVISAKRGSDTDKAYQKNTKAIKYWSAGTPEHKWSEEEKKKPPEAHYDDEGKITSPDKAHYGHKTLTDETGQKVRFHYQMQHVLHPRLVSVGKNSDGSDHMIPTDSRFKDEEYLPKNRFKSPTGKNAGHILVTTPTHSTSNEQHHTSFTHHVDDNTVAEIKKNKGVHEIDKPEDQMAAKGHEYEATKPVAKPMTIITHTSRGKSTPIKAP